MKKFLIVTFLIYATITSPILGMNKNVQKFFKNSFSKLKNAYTKMPESKKQLSKRLALSSIVGLSAWKIGSSHAHMHEDFHNNNNIDEKISVELSNEQKLFLEIIKYQPSTIPHELLQKLENNPELLRTVILFYFSHKKNSTISNSTIETTNDWEQILSQFTLEELYHMKDLSIVFTQKEPIEGLTHINRYEQEKKDIAMKNNSTEQTPDALSTECRNIALQHEVTIPNWIEFNLGGGFFSGPSTIIVSKNDDGTFGCTLADLGISDTFRLDDDEVAGILGHEIGHIVLAHHRKDDQFLFASIELSADRYVCFRSNKACLGNIKAMLKVIGLYRSKLKNDGLTDDEINVKLEAFGKFGKQYPPFQKRIKKMQKIMHEKKQTKHGFCKNPFYKQLGSNKWFKCKKQNKLWQNDLLITKNY